MTRVANSSAPPGGKYTLGQLAIFNGLLTQAQVDECLDIQKRIKERGFDFFFGRILIEMYYLDQASLRAILRAQAELEKRPFEREARIDILKLSPAEHTVLLDRVREQQLVAPEHIDRCYDLQSALTSVGIDKELGELLVEEGYLAREAIADLLARHDRLRQRFNQGIIKEPPPRGSGAAGALAQKIASPPGAPQILAAPPAAPLVEGSRPLLFGNIAAGKGLVADTHVREALYVQLRLKEVGVNKRIGEVMVLKDFMTAPQVKRVLGLQQREVGLVNWIELSRTQTQDPADMLLAQLLLANDILAADQVNECIFVLRAVRQLGFDKTLGDIIVDKEYLDREVVRGILKEHRRRKEVEKAAPPPADEQAQHRSLVLQEAYKAVLESKAAAEPSASSRMLAIRSGEMVVKPPPSYRGWIAAALGALVVVGVGLGAAVWSSRERIRQRETTAAGRQKTIEIERIGRGLSGAKTGVGAKEPPAPRPAWHEELGEAVAGLPLTKARRRLAAGAVLALASGVHLHPKGLFLLLSGLTRLPAGSILDVKLLRDEVEVQWTSVQVEHRPASPGGPGVLHGWLGPFMHRMADLFRKPAARWLPAGTYRFVVRFRPEEQALSLRKRLATTGLHRPASAETTTTFPRAGLEKRVRFQRERAAALLDAGFLAPLEQSFENLRHHHGRLLGKKLDLRSWLGVLRAWDRHRKQVASRLHRFRSRLRSLTSGAVVEGCQRLAAELDRLHGFLEAGRSPGKVQEALAGIVTALRQIRFDLK